MVFRIVITSLRPYDHYVCRDPWRACRRGHPGWCTKHRPQPSRSLRPRWLSRGCRGVRNRYPSDGNEGSRSVAERFVVVSRTKPSPAHVQRSVVTFPIANIVTVIVVCLVITFLPISHQILERWIQSPATCIPILTSIDVLHGL